MNGPQVCERLLIVEIKLPNSKGFAFQSLWEVEGETASPQERECTAGGQGRLLLHHGARCFHLSVALPSFSQKIVLKMRPSYPLRTVMWEIKGNVKAGDHSAKVCQQFGRGNTEAGIKFPVK